MPRITSQLAAIQEAVVACRRCPRLVDYIGGLRKEQPEWWCRPVPGFGDPRARVVVVGLAPGRAGSNRTGRMFTGDGSGAFMYPVLHAIGLASQPVATAVDDGLELRDCYITAAGRCAPPLSLLASYHPSRQNTQTGVLTAPMFRRIFERAKELAGDRS